MLSRFLYLFVAAMLCATPAFAGDDAQAAGASPVAKMENADKNAPPEAPPAESRIQIPDLPHPTGEKPSEADNEVAKHDDATAKEEPQHEASDTDKAKLRIALTPVPKLEKGVASKFRMSLTDGDDKPLGADALEERHTKKIHLLVVDESLTDYQHIHPVADGDDWDFSFTPATGHNYKIWVDITPKGGKSRMLPLFLKGEDACAEPCVDKKPSLAASFNDNKAGLSFDGPVTAGSPATATLKLSGPDGKPLKELEPVMGAYAHVAAFTDDTNSVAHVHPMGDEPKESGDRGASPLTFMLHPEKPGVLKLFVQIAIDDKDIFLPFTVQVDDAPKPAK